MFFQLEKTPPDVNRRSHPPQSQDYDVSLANNGPSSRLPPHPAIHSNPYDDPYYYYGALEMEALQGPSVGGPVDAPRGTGRPNMAGLRLDAGISGGIAKLYNFTCHLSTTVLFNQRNSINNMNTVHLINWLTQWLAFTKLTMLSTSWRALFSVL